MSTPSFMTIDCETSGLDWTTDKLHGIGVGYAEGESQYYPVWNIPNNIRADLENPTIPKVGHNLHAFDAKFIWKFGIRIAGEFNDTMVLGNLIGEENLSLKYLADKYLGEDSLESKQELDRYISQNKAGNIAGLCAKDLLDEEHPHTGVIARYCEEDVNNTTSLYLRFLQKLQELDVKLKSSPFFFKKSPFDYYYEEALPLERVLFGMEYRGIRVDLSAVEKVREECLAEVQQLERRLSKVFQNRIPLVEDLLVEKEREKVITEDAKAKRVKGEGKCQFSWSNNNHFGELLYRFSDLPEGLTQKTKKGKFQTDKTAIEKVLAGLSVDHPLRNALGLFSRYKRETKILNTYTGTNKKGLISRLRTDEKGNPRIHPVYRQTTGTGRLACSNPNMQNLKRNSPVKKFFIPDNDDEVFDDIDYSQIELRTGAHLSGDSGLCDAYRLGHDVHLRTASVLFNREITKADDVERQAGKRTNFLTIFDGGPHRLQTSLKADTGKDFTVEECQEFIRVWFQEYQEVRKYLDSQLEFFHKYRFCISETGRVRWLPDIVCRTWVKKIPRPSGGFLYRYVGPEDQRSRLEGLVKKKNQEISDRTLCYAAEGLYRHSTKMGYNQPIQGLAASMTKRSMIRLNQQRIKISNQVHDSLVISRKKSDKKTQQAVINTMVSVIELKVPVTVDVKTLSTYHPDTKVSE